MITKTNFKAVLDALDFEEVNDGYSKKVKGYNLQADFVNQRLIYPKGVKWDSEHTLNFSDDENFVVFECVHRLLELGYKPEHLTLEPKWKLGHGASGGRADIVIKNNDNEVFAIIECKTAGKQFEDAWSVGLQYPSQLFTYAQQEGTTQLLCLYTSDLEGGRLEANYRVIPLFDNQNLLEAKEDEEALTYKEAKRFDEKFNVWKNTYHSEAFSIGLFEQDIQPFHFGRKNYSINDLKEVAHSDIQKKYHQFATILRKYNVSGRENAFDKLVNLFLCKVVDEQENPTNLSFYWKGRAYDDDFQLQDRLQRLYQQGMKQFLDEEVTYINQEQIDEAFRYLEKDNDPDATKETINRYFKQLKFYTNNDFAFIDVHNERLFAENANVLRSIVEMLQDIRLKDGKEEHSNQFLGDMFEGFLDSGIKQSEGQYFTPMPIVKFIINSLPLDDIIRESEHPPKAIDYACGAGHFLTELAMQIKPLVKTYKGADEKEYYRNITGIEKEYRLSKVAKVSAFMYGQDEINIVYADALARTNELQNGTYNILVANPPYSVKGFLETLKHTDRKTYELFGSVDEKGIVTNNSIETFFIERAKQLLAPGGVAAIILPSSVLSNDAQLYRQARQILLQHFQIIAIAELGSGTFGKTGTNTVTLFLRRRKQNPAEFEHYRYRAECWIDGEVSPRAKKNKQYNDLHLLENYCRHIGIDYEDYKSFLQEEKPNEALQATEIWKEYEKAFYDRTDIKSWQKRPAFKSLKPAAQKKELDEMLYRSIRKIEQEKLYYYLLAQSNGVPVLVIKSPSDNKQMKKFLGYEWSSAKGNEGIKYMNTATLPEEGEDEPRLVTAQLNSIQTPLYNPAHKADNEKLNHYIIESFLGRAFTLPVGLSDYAHLVRLEKMLDFGRCEFNKGISLSFKKESSKRSQWEFKKLGEVFKIIAGQSPESLYYNEKHKGLPFYQGKKDFGLLFLKEPTVWTTKVTKLSVKNDVLMSVRAPVGDVNLNPFEEICIGRGLAALRSASATTQKYIFEYLSINKEIFEGYKGSTFAAISTADLSEIKIPLPPTEVQERIVEECNAIDQAFIQAQETIEDVTKEIERKVTHSELSMPAKNYVEPVTDIVDPKTEKGEVIYIGLENIEKNTGILTGDIRHPFSSIKSNKLRFTHGDILYGKLRPNLNKVYLSELEGVCSTDILVLRAKDSKYANLLSHYMRSNAFKDEAVLSVAGLRMPRTSWHKIENIKVPVYKNSEDLVEQIQVLEALIAAAKKSIEDAPTRKQAILKKWLE